MFDHAIFYVDRSSEDEQLFNKTIFVKSQKYECGG
jgi:hypothetical protein